MLRRINHSIARARDESGAVTVIIALCMTVFLGIAALVVDVGAGQARKAQLQNAADAAALGLAQQCVATAPAPTGNCATSVLTTSSSVAANLASKNINGGGGSVDSVQFNRDASTGETTVVVGLTMQQPSFFARIFNTDSLDISANATARWSVAPVALPLAFQDCALPTGMAPNSPQFWRYDALNLPLTGCGLLGGTLGAVLGPGWMTGTNLLGISSPDPSVLSLGPLSVLTSDCRYKLDLVSYVNSTLTAVLPSQCASMGAQVVGKQVLLPVYDHVLRDIVVNGVLLGHGYQVSKYALMNVTGYDFQTLDLNLGIITATIGPRYIPPGSPASLQCPNLPLLPIEVPACQGIQGNFQRFLTPTEAKQLVSGVQLTH